jgi:hypothetical protein
MTATSFLAIKVSSVDGMDETVAAYESISPVMSVMCPALRQVQLDIAKRRHETVERQPTIDLSRIFVESDSESPAYTYRKHTVSFLSIEGVAGPVRSGGTLLFFVGFMLVLHGCVRSEYDPSCPGGRISSGVLNALGCDQC